MGFFGLVGKLFLYVVIFFVVICVLIEIGKKASSRIKRQPYEQLVAKINSMKAILLWNDYDDGYRICTYQNNRDKLMKSLTNNKSFVPQHESYAYQLMAQPRAKIDYFSYDIETQTVHVSIAITGRLYAKEFLSVTYGETKTIKIPNLCLGNPREIYEHITRVDDLLMNVMMNLCKEEYDAKEAERTAREPEERASRLKREEEEEKKRKEFLDKYGKPPTDFNR